MSANRPSTRDYAAQHRYEIMDASQQTGNPWHKKAQILLLWGGVLLAFIIVLGGDSCLSQAQADTSRNSGTKHDCWTRVFCE